MLFLMSRLCGKMSTLFPAVPCVITAKIANFVGRFVAGILFGPFGDSLAGLPNYKSLQ
jgi:hypothetical protein